MRCSECETLPVDMARPQADPPSVMLRGLGRLRLFYCDECGTPLPPPDSTETLLAKLSQLARFGLSAGGKPILAETATHRSRVTVDGD
jgi:hypothetical protein